MVRISIVKELKELNDKSESFIDSIEILKDFLIDEGIEAILDSIEGDYIMFKKHLVEKLDKSKIEIYSNEHPPAHFHLNIAEFKGSYEIKTCNKLEGNIPKKYENKLILWYKNGGNEKLINVWNNTRPTNCTVGII